MAVAPLPRLTRVLARLLPVLLLAWTAPAWAQLRWTAYNPTTGAVLAGTTFEQAATFDPATNSYSFTIPANSAVTLVATNFIPLNMVVPASGSQSQAITFQQMTSAGGFSSLFKYANFGLFNAPAGALPNATSNNATAHTGLWVTAFNNGTSAYQTKPCGAPNATGLNFSSPADYRIASPNLAQNTTGFGLGTSRLAGTGVIADNTLYNVTFRVRANSNGSTQLGSANTPDSSAGAVWTDAATGGSAFRQAVYASTTNNGFTAPAVLNQFAYYFENGSAGAVTLTLANFQGYTSGGTAFPFGPAYFTTQPPATVSGAVGGAVSIAATAVSASVSGGPTTSFLWEYSSDGSSFSALDAAANPSVATSTLTLSDLQLTQAGFYRVRATTAGTGTLSGTTSLVSYSNATNLSVTTALLPPTIVTSPTDRTVLTGSSTTFTVAVGGSTPFTYEWSRRLSGEADFSVIPGATEASYTVSSVALADAGSYRVTVTNPQGSVTSAAAVLSVNQVPVITGQPVGGNLQPGQSITLSVAATGFPAPTYQWRRNGVAISGATASSYTISDATGASSGSYTVTVTNSVGTVTSAAAPVAVLSSTLVATARTPAAAGTVNRDTRLSITFNETPAIGSSGFLRIYDAADDSLVDTIDLVAANALRATLQATNALSVQALPVQNKSVGTITNFNYYPVTLSGQTATIYPRDGVLNYGRTYYVTVTPGFFTGDRGEAFAGIADKTTWRFTIKPVATTTATDVITVAADGSGDYDTVQGALDSLPANNTTPTLVRVKNGTYFEQVATVSRHLVTLLGESAVGTVITYPNNNNFNSATGQFRRSTFLANNVRDFTIANLTIQNTTPQNGTQAEALVIIGTGAATARNLVTDCRFFSYQDTILLTRQTYVARSVIHGDIDFMWGEGPAFFTDCDIRILRSGGYFTQVRNTAANHGFVFVNCRFTAPAGIVNTLLGRIDPSAFPSSEVVVLDSTFGDSANNNFLASNVAAVGNNYFAGWWLLNNATSATPAASVRYWTSNLVNASGAPLTNPGPDAFTVMPTDAALQANYRDPQWVLNTSISGTVNGTWMPALAPLIAVAPADRGVIEGNSVTLGVTAVGVPAVTYQWNRNGVPIAGATAATYTIASAGAADSGAYTVTVANANGTVTTAPAQLAVTLLAVAPTITTSPVGGRIDAGNSLTLFVVATGTAPLSYRWFKDGVELAGATSASLTLANALPSAAGSYTVTVTNSVGSVTGTAAVVEITDVPAPVADGFAADVTGGAAGQTVIVTTAADLRHYAGQVAPYVILVSGTIDLGADGRVNVTSHKTLRGAGVTSTILGTVHVGNATNVILSNLNISADTGSPSSNDGITIAASSRVLVTKCSIYNSTDGNLDIINGSDLVTVSWCKFYYTRDNGHNFSNLIGSNDTDVGTGDGRSNYRITWHHNWWTGLAKQRMIACRFGTSHLYNNYWNATGNDYCTETRNIAELFVEHNYYDRVKDPLSKRTALPTDVGLLMTLGNIFNACTGTQSTSTDVVFVPPYAYRLHAAADVPALVQAAAGNNTVATTATAVAGVTGPAGVVPHATTVTLTAVPGSLAPVSYQWRRDNAPIAGATSATLVLPSATSLASADYTVVLGLADGTSVVSTPYALTVGAPSARELWRQTNFGSTANTGSGADLADPDGDGLTNLLEYALGLDPNAPSGTNGLQLEADANDWIFTYRVPVDRSDVTVAVEKSTDLAAWDSAGLTPTLVSTTSGVSTYRVAFPRAGAPRLFFRLKATAP